MDIFELARIITDRNDGTVKDLIDNAIKIRNFIDHNPKYVKYLLEGKAISKEAKKSFEKKFKKEKILERSQEIKRHFKVKENLKLLNKYVKHMRTNSTGVYYNRTSGVYEQRK